jgi:hypothetical protein
MPYFCFRNSDNPPRPVESSLLGQDLSGYSAARGDFTVEYKQHAELDLLELEFTGDEDQSETGMLM